MCLPAESEDDSNNNNNPSGVTQSPLVRHQHDAARRKAKSRHYYTLQRPLKATRGPDLRTSQAHAHRCLGAPIRRSNFRAIRAHRDPVVRRFMTPCAPVVLTNSAVGVQDQDYTGTSWRSNNPFVYRVPEKASNVGSASSSGEYATMIFSCSSWSPGKPRQRTSTPPRRP